VNDKFGKASAGNGAGKDAVTRTELDQLKAQRHTPAPAMHYKMTGAAAELIHRVEESRRAIRASFIQERLDVAQDRATIDFSFAKMRGKAAYDFERSR
jgi:hypothetical protein